MVDERAVLLPVTHHYRVPAQRLAEIHRGGERVDVQRLVVEVTSGPDRLERNVAV